MKSPFTLDGVDNGVREPISLATECYSMDQREVGWPVGEVMICGR